MGSSPSSAMPHPDGDVQLIMHDSRVGMRVGGIELG